MLQLSALRRLANVPSGLGACAQTRDFVRFWRSLVNATGAAMAQTSFAYDLGIHDCLSSLVAALGAEADGAARQQDQFRAALHGAPLAMIPARDLPGEEDDPASPLGSYLALTPAISENGMVTVQMPESFTYFETLLQGPGCAAATARALHPQLGSDALAAVARAVGSITKSQSAAAVAAVARETVRATDDLILSVPFFPLADAVGFYRHGCRFYGQGELDYYKCSVTSGLVVPEEFYGASLYEKEGPGVATHDDLRPGRFADINIAGNGQWQAAALRGALSAVSGEATPNPYRPVYFDSSLARISERGGRFLSLVEVEGTGAKLREGLERWDALGKSDLYIADATAILAHFLAHPGVRVHFIRSFDTAWRTKLPRNDTGSDLFRSSSLAAPYLTSLLSARICVYTARGALSQINRGFWVNPSVLEYLERDVAGSWEMIPCYLLGLQGPALAEVLRMHRKGEGRRFWLDRYIHEPTRAMATAENAFHVAPSENSRALSSLARKVIDELLRPDLKRLTRTSAKDFVTLGELVPIFGRSYGRLRHWIGEYNLGGYSVQGHDHRFTREALEAFVREELAGKRGFGKDQVAHLLARIRGAFVGDVR